jgi:hypothetical protein
MLNPSPDGRLKDPRRESGRASARRATLIESPLSVFPYSYVVGLPTLRRCLVAPSQGSVGSSLVCSTGISLCPWYDGLFSPIGSGICRIVASPLAPASSFLTCSAAFGALLLRILAASRISRAIRSSFAIGSFPQTPALVGARLRSRPFHIAVRATSVHS